MITHDPSEYIRGLQQLLVSDKKKIAFLFGAGTSLARKNSNSPTVPAIYEMTCDIEKEITKEDKIKNAIVEIKEEIRIAGKTYTIETLLSNLEQKKQIIGNGRLNALNFEEIKKLIDNIKKLIRKKVCVHEKVGFKANDLIHADFAEWIGKIDRKYPIEIFTTNYDYLFECGLEFHNIPYYDGFSGSYKPFFYPESVEQMSFLPNQTKLWKIHGSLGWHYDEETKTIWRKGFDSDDSENNKDILIYPSTLKYDNSRKQPYYSLGDRLTNFLKQSDTILITCGYSFGDEHINERIGTALKSNSSTHVYVLNYDINSYIIDGDKTKEYVFDENSFLAKMAKENNKISIFNMRSAIIGCQYGSWKLRKEPDNEDAININFYFSIDSSINESDEKEEIIEESLWTGEGELILPDFSKFVRFIQSVVITSLSGVK